MRSTRCSAVSLSHHGGVLAVALVLLIACGGDDAEPTISGNGAAGGAAGAGGAGGTMIAPGDGGPGASSGTGASSGLAIPPDSEFTATDIGGYALGQPIGAASSDDTGLGNVDAQGCEVMLAVVRDFKGANEPGGHPDFESYSGEDATVGLVASKLATDRKPLYASQCEAAPDDTLCPYGQQTTDKASFDQWYRFTQDINKPYHLFLKFAKNGAVFTFYSTRFFPLDGAGWGNSGEGTDHQPHNFGFTTELHTKFKYAGGETFSFSGDDDVWVFINGKLAVDIGGLHPPTTGSVDLDESAGEFGLTPGTIYPLELFHAERHTNASNFRVDTTLSFVDCGSTVPDKPK